MKSRNKEDSLIKFFYAIPDLLIYQVITKGLLFVLVYLLKQAALWYLYRMGRSAITSGDLPYILRSPQGWVVLVIGLLALLIYTVFDINAMFLLSDNVLHQRKKPWWSILKEAFVSLRYFTHPQGFFVTLYMGLLGPLIGTAAGISFMVGFSAPNFILNYISDNLWLRVLVFLGVILYLVVMGIYIFTILNVIFKRQKINVGMKSSRYQVTSHWKEFLSSMVGFFLRAGGIFLLVEVGTYFLPMALLSLLPLPQFWARALQIFFTAAFLLGNYLYVLLFCPFLAMKITVLYEYYENLQTPVIFPEKENVKRNRLAAAGLAVALVVISLLGAWNFDTFFPVGHSVRIVAHRAGGNLTTENTVSALKEAIRYGADVAEIDVQRTADGEYIVCHDRDLEKLTGVAGDPKKLTLAKIKEYRIKNTARPWEEGDEIPTLEEMLDAAEGNIDLFIELKGKTADEQMVKDVYEMVRERNMLSQCVFICFSYGTVEYIEDTYPDVETGYLVYFSFGNLEDLNCDDLFVETECLSAGEIDRIHENGKKVGVWTVNATSDLNIWLLSDVDYIVTDEVRGALALKRILYHGDDSERILSGLSLRF